VQGLEAVDTLAVVSEVSQTSFVDSTLAQHTTYVYRISVANASGFEVTSTDRVTLPLRLPGVRITTAEFHSQTASATLAWTPYRGSGFAAYQVLRRTQEQVAEVVCEITDRADTSFVDAGLLGNTEYFYQVVVLTEGGEEVPGEEESGAFHRLLATWPLDFGETVSMRLYAEPDDRIVVLIPIGERIPWVKLLVFDPDGHRLEEQLLTHGCAIYREHSWTTVRGPDGKRYLGVADRAAAGVLIWEADGTPVRKEQDLFVDAFPDALSGVEATVLGEIALGCIANAAFDNVVVSAEEGVRFEERFDRESILTKEGWEIIGAPWIDWDHEVLLTRSAGGGIRRADESWRNFRLEVDVAEPATGTQPSIQIGGSTFSRFSLALDYIQQQILLDWVFSPPEESDLPPQEQRHSVPFTILGGLFYRLGLEVVNGRVQASVREPAVFATANESERYWCSLAAIGSTLAFTVYDQSYGMTPEGQVVSQARLESGVSEIRVWEGKRGQQVGVCLPEARKLLMCTVPEGEAAAWTVFLTQSIGPLIGVQEGLLSYPLSFDVGPDGRIFVLDAGASRILVFDPSRRFLTQWGRKGSGEGEFNWGHGARRQDGSLDFVGSVAVDSQGYIYIADKLNRRIQKFAP